MTYQVTEDCTLSYVYLSQGGWVSGDPDVDFLAMLTAGDFIAEDFYFATLANMMSPQLNIQLRKGQPVTLASGGGLGGSALLFLTEPAEPQLTEL